jgi:glycosyltransferase involved in cell wall biosynthesis
MDQPRVSVIIPVKNQEQLLAQCLGALRESGVPDMEIIVADDHSTDNTAGAAAAGGARVVSVDLKHGVSAARNAGAAAAHGEILVFTDADVVFPQGALGSLINCMDQRGVDGAVGVFAAQTPFRNFASIWKNQWMRYTYRRMPDRIALFFTSAAAVRADAFHASGGFDENYGAPSVEDTAMGRCLARMGCHIRLCRDAEVVHHKHYSAVQVLGVDCRRACALVRLVLRERFGADKQQQSGAAFSVPPLYPLGALALCVAVVLAPASVVVHSIPLFGVAAALWFFAFASAADFLAHLRREHGLGAFLAGQIFWFADCAAVTLGAGAGVLGFVIGKRY